MAETPAPFEPDRPDLALVQLRRVREAARERGEAPLRAKEFAELGWTEEKIWSKP